MRGVCLKAALGMQHVYIRNDQGKEYGLMKIIVMEGEEERVLRLVR